MKTCLSYSIVIPVYNSNKSLHQLVNRLAAIFINEVKDSFEILFIDDFSTNENTWSTLSGLADTYDYVRSYKLTKNFGQGGALLAGMSKVSGEWVITMDDDLQHLPEDIPKLIEKKDHDVVIGRFPEKQCGQFKKISSRIKGYLDNKLLKIPQGIVSTPFKLMKKRVVDDILALDTPRPFMVALVLAVTADLVNVDVSHDERKFGRSNYSLRKSLSLLSNLLFNNSSFFLRAMSLFGFLLAGLSFFLGLYFVVRKMIYQDVVQGWTSLMVVILLLSGSIIFCIGVVGEYVSRLIEISSRRPRFLFREDDQV